MNTKPSLDIHYYFLLSLLLWTSNSYGQIIISEYVEGTGRNQCIEIFNTTNEDIVLTDNYSIEFYFNGSTTPIYNRLEGTIRALDTHIICTVSNGTIGDENLGTSFNGDDAFALTLNDAVIDVFGSIGCDPGEGWIVDGVSTRDVTLRRKPCISKGATTGGGCIFPNSGEWEAFPVNTTNGLGSHEFGLGIEVEIIGNNALCENAEITLEATEGFSSYQWSNGSRDRIITVSAPGNYTVTAITDKGCTDTDFKRVNGRSPEIFAEVTNVEPVSCRPKKDGSFTVQPSGGSGGFSFESEFGLESSSTISGLGIGIYDVTVSDNNGCAVIVSAEIDGVVTVPLGVNSRGETCVGRKDGRIILSAQGSNLQYSIDNINFSTQTTYTDLLPGAYHVAVMDETGCGDEKLVSIDPGSQFNLRNSIITQAKCQGEGGGQIILQPEGGSGPYEVSFDGGPFKKNDLTHSDLKADTFEITIRDVSGCEKSFLQEIEPGSDLVVKETNIIDATCLGVSDGEITIEYDGGSGTVSFNKRGEDGVLRPSFNPHFKGLSVGWHNIIVQDSKFDCRIPIDFEITERDPLLTNVISPLPCTDVSKGRITILPQNGAAPYEYSLDSGLSTSTNTFIDLDPKKYVVTTKDGRGCMKADSVSFGTAADFEIAFVSPRHESCVGNNDGQITVATNSTNPVEFSIDGVRYEESNVFSGLTPNDYTIYARSGGCQDTAKTTILSATPIGLDDITPRISFCEGDDDGQLTVEVGGGKSPYLYQLDDGAFQTDNVFTDLIAGVYEITVRDSNLCEQTFTDIILAGPTRLELECVVAQNVTTFEGMDGRVDITIFGGASPYDVQLVDAGFNNIISLDGLATFNNLPAGDYQVQISDRNDCVNTCTFSITQPLCDFSISVDSSNPTCYDSLNGRIVLALPMTSDPLTITWSDPQYNGQQSLTGLAEGTYEVTISDPTGCLDSSEVTLVAPDTFKAVIIADNETICAEDLAQLSLGATYAEYLWSTNETLPTILVDTAGTYQVTVKDAVGCTATTEIAIEVVPQDTIYENRFTCDIASVGTFEVEERGLDGCTDMIFRTFELARQDTTNVEATTCNLDQVGTVPTLLTNQFGCDSLIRTTYKLLRSDTTYLTQTSCTAQNVGFSRMVLTNTVGCDSILIIETTLDETVEQTFLTVFTCEMEEERVDTIFENTLGGCDSLIITRTISAASNPTILTASTCDPANVRIDTFSLLNQFACDSMVIVNTTLAQTDFLSLVEETCNPQDSGLVTQFLVNRFGCDSIVATQTNLSAIDACAVDFTVLADEVCWNESMGMVDINIRTGNPPFDYFVLNDFFGDTLQRGTIDQISEQIDNIPVGQYSVILINAQNISQRERVEVRQSSKIDIQATFSDYNGFAISCEGAQDGTIDLTINGGEGPYNFQWETGEQTAFLQNISVGNYVVTITDAANCSNVANFDLTAGEGLSIDFQIFSPRCFGDVVGGITIYDVPNANGGVEYSLDGTFFQPMDQLPFTIEKLATAEYQLFIQDENDCQATTIFSIPRANDNQLNLGADRNLALGDSLIILPEANFVIDRFEWSANVPITCRDCLDLKMIPTTAGKYTLTAFDENDCATSTTVTVNLNKKSAIYLPNVFSPNSDGLNDIYQIYADNSVTKLNSLRIYDYEGRLMYQIYDRAPNDPTVGWDGVFNGQKMLPAVFVVFAEVELVDGTMRAYSQTFTLIN